MAGIATKLVKKPFFGRFAGEWRWPNGVDPAPWEQITIKSPSGVELSAVHAEAMGSAHLAVVMAHPMGRAAKGFWLRQGHADLFRSLGCHVLAFDFNGFGESPSGSFDYPSDLLAAGLFMRDRHPDVPIAVVSASFGGAWTICALARSHPFAGAFIEATFPTLAHFWRRYPVPYATLKTTSLLAPRLEKALRPIAQAPSVKDQPIVRLLYSKTDEFTPPEYGYQIAEALGSVANVEIETVSNAEHTFIFRDAEIEYRKTATDFIEAIVRRQ